jgi:hypothetical protein
MHVFLLVMLDKKQEELDCKEALQEPKDVINIATHQTHAHINFCAIR